MQCPQCQRKAPPQRDRCLYCGADLRQNGAKGQGAVSTQRDANPQSDGHTTVAVEEKTDQTAIERLAGLPEPLRQKALEALKEKGGNDKWDEQTVTQTHVDLQTGSLLTPVSLEESLYALARIKGQFDTDLIDYDLYRQMVIETIKSYLEGLDRKTKLTYVANDMKSTEVFSYLDEDMHRELLKYALTEASEPDSK